MRLSLAFLLLIGFAAARADDHISYPAKEGPGKGKKLVFLTGDEEYRGEEGLPMLAKILSQKYGFACTVLFPLDKDGNINPDLSNLGHPEAIDTADGLVLALRYRKYPDDLMKRIDAAVKRGIPVIGLRTSTHAFNGLTGEWAHYNKFGRTVLGESWVSHWGNNRKGLTKSEPIEAAKGHPVMKGVGTIFADSGVYEVHPVADATLLLNGFVLKGMNPTDPLSEEKKKRASDKVEQGMNDPPMVSAWVREPKDGKGNKVLCTTMGAATDLKDENLRRLVVNGVLWSFGLPVPDKADVAYIDPYEPSNYAFKGYRRGIKPEDHAIGKVLPAGLPVKDKK